MASDFESCRVGVFKQSGFSLQPEDDARWEHMTFQDWLEEWFAIVGTQTAMALERRHHDGILHIILCAWGTYARQEAIERQTTIRVNQVNWQWRCKLADETHALRHNLFERCAEDRKRFLALHEAVIIGMIRRLHAQTDEVLLQHALNQWRRQVQDMGRSVRQVRRIFEDDAAYMVKVFEDRHHGQALKIVEKAEWFGSIFLLQTCVHLWCIVVQKAALHLQRKDADAMAMRQQMAHDEELSRLVSYHAESKRLLRRDRAVHAVVAKELREAGRTFFAWRQAAALAKVERLVNVRDARLKHLGDTALLRQRLRSERFSLLHARLLHSIGLFDALAMWRGVAKRECDARKRRVAEAEKKLALTNLRDRLTHQCSEICGHLHVEIQRLLLALWLQVMMSAWLKEARVLNSTRSRRDAMQALRQEAEALEALRRANDLRFRERLGERIADLMVRRRLDFYWATCFRSWREFRFKEFYTKEVERHWSGIRRLRWESSEAMASVQKAWRRRRELLAEHVARLREDLERPGLLCVVLYQWRVAALENLHWEFRLASERREKQLRWDAKQVRMRLVDRLVQRVVGEGFTVPLLKRCLTWWYVQIYERSLRAEFQPTMAWLQAQVQRARVDLRATLRLQVEGLLKSLDTWYALEYRALALFGWYKVAIIRRSWERFQKWKVDVEKAHGEELLGIQHDIERYIHKAVIWLDYKQRAELCRRLFWAWGTGMEVQQQYRSFMGRVHFLEEKHAADMTQVRRSVRGRVYHKAGTLVKIMNRQLAWQSLVQSWGSWRFLVYNARRTRQFTQIRDIRDEATRRYAEDVGILTSHVDHVHYNLARKAAYMCGKHQDRMWLALCLHAWCRGCAEARWIGHARDLRFQLEQSFASMQEELAMCASEAVKPWKIRLRRIELASQEVWVEAVASRAFSAWLGEVQKGELRRILRQTDALLRERGAFEARGLAELEGPAPPASPLRPLPASYQVEVVQPLPGPKPREACRSAGVASTLELLARTRDAMTESSRAASSLDGCTRSGAPSRSELNDQLEQRLRETRDVGAERRYEH